MTNIGGNGQTNACLDILKPHQIQNEVHVPCTIAGNAEKLYVTSPLVLHESDFKIR
jgi:hypothetical protein